MATVPDRTISSTDPQPAWDVALLYPNQGEWSEGEYLGLDTNRLVELIDGNLEVLPMPTIVHQLIVEFLFDVLRGFVKSQNLGKVFFAPLPLFIRTKTFREPDIIFISKETGVQPTDKCLREASLVMEIVSADDKSHKRDYQEKRADYAQLGVPEYWIVDPQQQQITVLALESGQYNIHGEFVLGEQATSKLLPGFVADVSAVFAAGQNLS